MRVIAMPTGGRRAATSSRAAHLARRHNAPRPLTYHVLNFGSARPVVLLNNVTLNWAI
jgi:hypothetical protein